MRQMKTILILAVSLFCVTGMSAQQSGGDYFEGLSRKIGFSRMITKRWGLFRGAEPEDRLQPHDPAARPGSHV